MKFGDKTNPNLFKQSKSTKILGQYVSVHEDPLKIKKLHFDNLWTKVKDTIFETERPILKNLSRHVNMTMN